MKMSLLSKNEVLDLLLQSEKFDSKLVPKLKSLSWGKDKKNILHLASKYINDYEFIIKLVNEFHLCPSKRTQITKRLPIHIASRYGNEQSVRALIKICTLGVNRKDFEGDTPLSLACISGHTDTAEVLLLNSASCLIKNNFKLTSIDLAIKSRSLKILDCFSKYTPENFYKNVMNLKYLQFSIQNNCAEVVLFFLEKIDKCYLCSFDNLKSILTLCSKNSEMIEVILEFIKERKINKIAILLELKVETFVIMKYCQEELFANAFQLCRMYDREDLLEQCYNARIIQGWEIDNNKIRMRPRCQNYLARLGRWNRLKSCIFLREHLKTNLSTLTPGLFRELLSFL